MALRSLLPPLLALLVAKPSAGRPGDRRAWDRQPGHSSTLASSTQRSATMTTTSSVQQLRSAATEASTLRHRVVHLTVRKVPDVKATPGGSGAAPSLQGLMRMSPMGGAALIGHARHIAATVVRNVLNAGVEVITYVIEYV